MHAHLQESCQKQLALARHLYSLLLPKYASAFSYETNNSCSAHSETECSFCPYVPKFSLGCVKVFAHFFRITLFGLKKNPGLFSTVLICHSLRKSTQYLPIGEHLAAKIGCSWSVWKFALLRSRKFETPENWDWRIEVQGFFCMWLSVYFEKFRQSEMSCEVSSDNCQQ